MTAITRRYDNFAIALYYFDARRTQVRAAPVSAFIDIIISGGKAAKLYSVAGLTPVNESPVGFCKGKKYEFNAYYGNKVSDRSPGQG